MIRQCCSAGVELIKDFESCKLVAYQDGNGIWTIGWGHTGPEVVEGLVWSQDKADMQFLADLAQRAETPVGAYIYTPLTDNQFAAFCSLCYNIGSGNFHNSTAAKYANAGRLTDVPTGIAMWNKINGHISPGLVRRRNAEIALWNAPDETVL